MDNQKNTIIAIALSALVLVVWQYFVGMPQAEKQRQIAQQQSEQRAQPAPAVPATAAPQPQQPGSAPQAPAQPGAAPGVTAPSAAGPGQALPRAAVIAASARITLSTPTLAGSIDLKGGRIDDLSLVKYHTTVDPNSPPVVLLSPSGSPEPLYAEFGWVAAPGAPVKLPGPETIWRQEGSGALEAGRPIMLVYDNGEGLEFRRTISVDDKYLFTVKDEVANKTSDPVTLFPYALISRHGKPRTLGFFILHEGLIAVMGDEGLQEITYSDVEDKKEILFNVTNAWLGITDKYWAATLLPDTSAHLRGRFSAGAIGNVKTYQTDYLLDPVTVAAGGKGSASTRLFAGAKEVAVVDGYDKQLNLN
ncbi:MAG: membrane protein insertase YidC, partial [Xanthobacteraceae bacterium]